MPGKKKSNESSNQPVFLNEKGLTKEQILFLRGKLTISDVKKQADIENRELTHEEKTFISNIKKTLFKNIMTYGMKLAHEMLSPYSNVPFDAYSELQSEITIVFFERFDEYDPLYTTPSTFFVRYFKEKISKYIQANCTHLSQYDSNNARKVQGAINYYKSQGITWTEDMISNYTGLSTKVVRTTIKLKENANFLELDSECVTQLRSPIPTPEEYTQDMESKEVLYRVISELDEESRNIFLMRVNPDGTKQISFENIANALNKSIKDVKCIYNETVMDLSNNSELRHMFGKDGMRYRFIKPIKLQDKSADIMEQFVLESI